LPRFGLALVLALCSTGQDCFAETGYIREKGTGKPIAGAILVAEWNGTISMPVQPTHTCYKVEVATSDANGRFEISAFSWDFRPFLMDRSRGLRIFAPGMRESRESNNQDLRILMEPDTGTEAERMERLSDPLRSRGCVRKDEAVFLPLLRAVKREFEKFPPTAKTKDSIDFLGYEIDVLEKGEAEAERRRRQLRAEITKRVMVHLSRGVPTSPADHNCCFSFGDVKGYPELEARVKSAGLEYSKRESTREICVQEASRSAVQLMASEIATSFR
jgi:hypothetical protein